MAAESYFHGCALGTTGRVPVPNKWLDLSRADPQCCSPQESSAPSPTNGAPGSRSTCPSPRENFRERTGKRAFSRSAQLSSCSPSVVPRTEIGSASLRKRSDMLQSLFCTSDQRSQASLLSTSLTLWSSHGLVRGKRSFLQSYLSSLFYRLTISFTASACVITRKEIITLAFRHDHS
jgi:hypothetical protein